MVETSPLRKFLKKHSRIFIDTSIFIYFIEQHPRYQILCEPVFQALEVGKIKANTSSLSLMEILVQPYKKKADDLVLKFYALFTTYPNLNWIDLNLAIADIAAKLRADYRLKTPDAIQAASAVSSGVTGFLCNDTAFKRVKEFECFLLDDCLKKQGFSD